MKRMRISRLRGIGRMKYGPPRPMGDRFWTATSFRKPIMSPKQRQQRRSAARKKRRG